MNGAVGVYASDTSAGTTHVGAIAVSAGIGFAAAGSTATTTVDPSVTAYVNGSTVSAGGEVSIAAAEDSYGDAQTDGISFGLFAGAGSTSTSTVTPTVKSYITGNSVATSANGIWVSALYNSTWNGASLASAATNTAPLGAAAQAAAAAGGLVGSSGSTSSAEEAPTVSAYASSTTLSAPGVISISAGSWTFPSANTSADTLGLLAAVGSTEADSTSDGHTNAYFSGFVVSSAAVAVNSAASADPTASASAAGGGIVSGNGASATAKSKPDSANDPISTASVSGSIISTGGMSVSASYSPGASATASGASAGVLAVGASVATSVASGNVTASVADGTGLILPGGLAISASRTLQGTTDSALSSSVASSGGLIGVDATVADASSTGSVSAKLGNNIALPLGDVSIAASDTTAQEADASGIAVGLVGVGASIADASSGVTTTAELGSGETTAVGRTGVLNIHATGTDGDVASTVAGSGGLIAGDASAATTEDTSSAAATLDASPGELLYAGGVVIDAHHISEYGPYADSTQASLAGASGAYAGSTSTANATTTVPAIEIISGGAMTITAEDDFQKSLPHGNTSVSAGAGGALNELPL